MEISQKHAFWEALIIAIFIFGFGILIGVFIENARQERVSDAYLISEINLLDIEIQTKLLDLENINCEEIMKKNIEFADKVYEDAKTLQSYEEADRITDFLMLQHKRYDLLRTLLWINSIKIKQKCKADFHTIVYLYDYNPQEVEQRSKQEIFSRFLQELKQEKGNKIILIPIAKNLNLNSLNALTSNLSVSEISIIVDEGKLVISEPEEFTKIIEYLK